MQSKFLITGSALAILASSAAFAGDAEWFPPDPPSSANSGECYARVRIEPQYDAFAEQVVTQDSYERYDVRPPRLREETREYVSREAGVRYIVHEPVYNTITETVQVRPAYSEYVVQPAVHDTVTETIMVREPRQVWRRGFEPGASMTRYDSETGEIWCLVEEAGEYRTVTRNVIVQPAEINEITHPAEFSTITREVLVQAASVEEIPIDPRYDSYSIQVVDQPATVDSHVIPVSTDTVTRYTLRSEERWEWRLMNCDDIDLPGHNPPMSTNIPAVAANQPPAPGSSTYLYGTDMPAGDQSYSEEMPVAQASYSGSSYSARRRN
ncbi:hypothetical protein [uncultured Maricaulis sp.]|uniref:hypothetical protein n=1 Tax=uncultured Maricaulis sp. TaxID=174710 RepID=UPI0030D8CB7A|tara:strand:- start:53205 stop:54176 length:972 start_codon:yes stop_codon:yes gene_type:complete